MSVEKTIRSYFEAFNAGDVEALAEMYASTTEYRQPFMPTALTTPADVKAFESGMFAGFSDVSVELAWLVAEGDSGAAGAVISAKHTGAMPLPDGGELPATGALIRLETAEHFRVDSSGKIVAHQRYMDSGALMGQLGIGP